MDLSELEARIRAVNPVPDADALEGEMERRLTVPPTEGQNDMKDRPRSTGGPGNTRFPTRAAAIAAILVVAAGAVGIIVATNDDGPVVVEPTSTTTETTIASTTMVAEPSTTTVPSTSTTVDDPAGLVPGETLEPGRHTVADFAVPFSFELVEDDWFAAFVESDAAVLCRGEQCSADVFVGAGAHPSLAGESGFTPDQMADAFEDDVSVDVADRVEVTVGGATGWSGRLTLSEDAPAQSAVVMLGDNEYTVFDRAPVHFWTLDVGGTTVTVFAQAFELAADEFFPVATDLVSSIRWER